MTWDNGISILPALYLTNVATDSVIDMTLALVPRRGLNAEMAAQLTALVPQIPAPVMHPTNTAFTGELRDVVSQLRKNLPKSCKRTQHLAAAADTAP